MPAYRNPQIRAILEGNAITWEEFKRFYRKAWDEEHRNMLLFAFLSGIRPVEVESLRRECFEKDGKNLTVRIETAKGGVTRKIFIPICNKETEELREFVFKKVFPKEYVFPYFARVKNPRDAFQYSNKRCEIGIWVDGEFYPHSLYVFRHNIATLLAQEGVDPIAIRLFRGEKLNPRLFGSLGHYLHFSRKMGIEIAKALRKIMKE